MAKIVARYCHQFPPLGAIDRCFRGLDIVRGPRLHLDKAQNVSIPTDQIDFPSPPRAAVVACHHHIPDLTQVEISIFFPMTAGLLMLREVFGAQYSVGKAIQGFDYETCEAGWHGLRDQP